MSNKKVAEKYMDGFIISDHFQILSCPTDHIVGKMPGLLHLEGNEQFDAEIEK